MEVNKMTEVAVNKMEELLTLMKESRVLLEKCKAEVNTTQKSMVDLKHKVTKIHMHNCRYL